jgi:hypothetical protein
MRTRLDCASVNCTLSPLASRVPAGLAAPSATAGSVSPGTCRLEEQVPRQHRLAVRLRFRLRLRQYRHRMHVHAYWHHSMHTLPQKYCSLRSIFDERSHASACERIRVTCQREPIFCVRIPGMFYITFERNCTNQVFECIAINFRAGLWPRKALAFARLDYG